MLLFYEYGMAHNVGFQLVAKEMWMVRAKVFLNITE